MACVLLVICINSFECSKSNDPFWQKFQTFIQNRRVIKDVDRDPVLNAIVSGTSEVPSPTTKKKEMGPFLKMFPKNAPQPDFTEDDVGKPLFLTPLINTGKVDEARDLARVHNISDIESYSGFLTVKAKFDSNLFFWFVPSKVIFVYCRRNTHWHKDAGAPTLDPRTI